MCKKLFFLTSFVLVLALAGTNVVFGDLMIERRIAGSNDDAEDYVDVGAGADSPGSSDLEMPYQHPPADGQVVGLRFLNIAIPKGATIINAYVQFTADNEKLTGGPVNLIINGLLQLNPGEFGGEDFYITREPKTSAEVKWTDIPAWTSLQATPASTTPDISAVIQEIIDQASWVVGNNALILFIRDDETNPSAAIRSALSTDEGNIPGALLHIRYQ